MSMNPTPEVSCKYGAPMGRRGNPVHPGDDAEVYNGKKMHLRRIPLDRGGYDKGGAYWGVGAPLWWFAIEADDGSVVEEYFRAGSRERAKEIVRERVPGSWTFYGERGGTR